ncbi:MAG: hypothetical protein K1Y36_04820 [Blastocatellia bacterium]|nr:hypothetical protein [Blastocatellia bacterium]
MTLVTTFALPALAQNTPKVDKRQKNQQQRINQGVQNGELTKREARHLEKHEAKLQAKETKAKSDGVVTPEERARLQKAENRNSRKIYRRKHNNNVRG